MTDEKLRQEQADEEMINQGFQHLLESYITSKHRKKVEIITKAFNFAKQAHKGVGRRSALAPRYKNSNQGRLYSQRGKSEKGKRGVRHMPEADS